MNRQGYKSGDRNQKVTRGKAVAEVISMWKPSSRGSQDLLFCGEWKTESTEDAIASEAGATG